MLSGDLKVTMKLLKKGSTFVFGFEAKLRWAPNFGSSMAPGRQPRLVYYSLITVEDNGYQMSDSVTVEVTQYNPPFQSEDLTVCRPDGPKLFARPPVCTLKVLSTCASTGTGKLSLPQRKLFLIHKETVF